MSWSLTTTGTPSEVVQALDQYGATLTGFSQEEFDAAKPHLAGAVQQNTGRVTLEASGHASGHGTDHFTSECRVSLTSAPPLGQDG
jgi:hypothetical protein